MECSKQPTAVTWDFCYWHKIPVFIGGEKSPLLGALRTLLDRAQKGDL
jgi:hypothetical protein